MSFSNWRKYNIGELGRVITGKTPSTKDTENFGGIFPFITIPDLGNKVFIDSSERSISDIGASKMKSLLLPPNSVMMSCIATIGKCGITTKPSFTNQQINSVICNQDIIDPLFLYYTFTQLGHELEATGGGGSVYTNVSKSRFSEISVSIPPLPTQRRIADILSTLDEKIELNRQTNITLEAIAQSIFREWFVEFNFPNATSEMVKSELGMIPQGWRVAAFEDELEADRGLSYKGAGLESGNAMPMHNLNSVYEGGGYKFDGIKYYSGEYKEKHIIRPGDLIVTNTEQGHKYLLIGYPAIIPSTFGDIGIYSHHIYRVRPKENSYLTADFVYQLLLQPVIREQVVGFANGTTVNMLKIEGLQKPKFVLPPKELVYKFSEIAKSNRLKIEENIEQSKALASTRDALLPKLMSGEINV